MELYSVSNTVLYLSWECLMGDSLGGEWGIGTDWFALESIRESMDSRSQTL